MWYQRGHVGSKEGTNGLVAVAIDKDSKGSQNALKWTTDHLVGKGHNLILIHVRLKQQFIPSQSLSSSRMNHPPSHHEPEHDQHMKGLFLPFHCFCTRKDISCKDVILEDTDIVKALVEYVTQAAIENLVLGAASKSGFRRFKMTDISSSVAKNAPDFCYVYVISKEKISFMRSASRPAPVISSVHDTIPNRTSIPEITQRHVHNVVDTIRPEKTLMEPVHSLQHDVTSIKSPFTRGRAANGRSYGEITLPETDISFVNSDRPSTSTDSPFPSFYDTMDNSHIAPRISISDIENPNFESPRFGRKSVESQISPHKFLSEISEESDDNHSWSSENFEDAGMQMRRIKLELKQTMDMYNTACKEATTARQKAMELESWKIEEEQKLEKAQRAEEAALALAEKEKVRSKAAFEYAETAKKIAELESQKRILAEMKVLKESEAKQVALNALANSDIRYRKYSIEEIEIATDYFKESHKIGEGSYGPVYKCFLDHTQVAVKVLRPEAAQGRSQFQKEVEVLSCIRHPNMVLLLGACPEYGCLVYEYMANGSLDDRLFMRGNTPPLPWQLRFKIAADISTGLLFLHQTKPEPLVHRDLKPGNILLDRNFISKIGDVGLARLVPPSVADTATQYRMTSTAGTFCYIDPEYQQTGMLGIKSDIYSLGIMFLQLITARPPMGLTYHVQRAIEEGTLGELLDPSVPDWPAEETLRFANVALKCAELRRKDRPDFGSVVLPELEKLRAFAECYMYPDALGISGSQSPVHWKPFSSQDVFSSYSNGVASDYGSSGASTNYSISKTQ